ncbi:hexosaminidase D-like [Euwallacea similis]|uniref:hexosaminidase D-like n=1 Tax=Euwallacea similis TaxID=1736056 RepID=UPI00344BE3AF
MKLVFNLKLITVLSGIIIILLVFYALNIISTRNANNKTASRKTYKNIKQSYSEEIRKIDIPERIVHIDLKGAPPKISYFSQLLPLLRKLGATGILLEYEDMFPYSGQLSNVSALNAYTLEDVREIIKFAQTNNLKIIPFIQVFGQLDFLLKLNSFVDFREVSSFPSTICPSGNNTLPLLQSMIEQVIDVHNTSDMIHIGFGAVPFLGHCHKCINRMVTQQLTKTQLFLEHLRCIVTIIKQKNPGLKVLIWDDFFRTCKQEEVDTEFAKSQITPVVWWYGKDVYDELGPSLWNTYRGIFDNVWLGSAFKGTSGSSKYVSDINHYIQNQKSWLSVIEEYQEKINFQGIILTGRQRYDHFAVLCELLPVGIPALAMSLRLLQGFKDSPLGPPLEVAKILQCDQPYGLIGTAFGSPKCKFPGADVLEFTIHFHQLQQDFLEITDDFRVKGWLSEYNKLHSYSNPKHIEEIAVALDRIKSELEVVNVGISNAMLKVYDEFTVVEWLDTYLLPFKKEVSSLWEAKKRILSTTSWQRKPLSHSSEL